MIKINEEGKLIINKTEYQKFGDECYTIPIEIIGKINMNEFPINIKIQPEGTEFKNIMEIINLGNNKVSITINSSRMVDEFDEITLMYQEIKRKAILSEKKMNPEILVFEEDDDIIVLFYTIEVKTATINDLVNLAEKFDQQTDSIADNYFFKKNSEGSSTN